MQNLKLKILFFVIIICGAFGVAEKTWAADFYIAQNTSGSDNGVDCANAHSVVWFNTSGNWSNPKAESKIGPGDTVHLCGTISSTLIVEDSGSDDNVITIFFDPGAKLSQAAWGTAESSSIYANGKNYIVIDGGENGTIENTDNGTGLGNSVNSTFLNVSGNPSNWEVKNLTFSNMYVRAEGTETNAYGTAAEFSGMLNNISFHDNVVHDGNKVVYFSWYGGASANISVYNNSISDSAVAITVGSGYVDSSIDNVQMYNNDLSRGLKWSGTPTIHTDLTHVFAAHTNTQVTGLKIYNNYYHGACGTNTTTALFGEGMIIDPKYYNNLFVMDVNPGNCSNGMIYLKQDDGALIANNTFISTDGVTAIELGGVTNAVVKNNLFNNGGIAIGPFSSSSSVIESDYNLFSSGETFLNGSWTQLDLPTWKTAHETFELYSKTGSPLLDGNFKPQSGSPAIDHGVSLAGYFIVDKAGVSRPQGSSWDIGAYEYSGTDATSPAVPGGLSVE